MLAVTAVLSVVLWASPDLDLAVTRLFYLPGQGFPASSIGFLRDLRGLGMAVFTWTMIAAGVALLSPFLADGGRFLMPPRAGLFLLSVGALGPGVLVNLIFKEHWGRARPISVIEFGGSRTFSAPWVIADGCTSNCSFVSGEGSSSIFMVALALLVPAGWKRPVLAAALAFAAVMSLNRIAFGGHFLSDVMIAWCLTITVILCVHRAIYAPTSPLTDDAIADRLGAAGRVTRRWLRTRIRAIGAFFARFR